MMSALPIMSKYIVTALFAPSPVTSPTGLVLRLQPVLLMALALTPWQYRWRHVVVFCLSASGINLGLLFFVDPIDLAFHFEMMVTVIQTISFLAVGYFISTLMSRLRAQQASLEQANAQLVQNTRTLEHLTISRERNRMARELHDTLAHTLSGLTIQLETVKAY